MQPKSTTLYLGLSYFSIALHNLATIQGACYVCVVFLGSLLQWEPRVAGVCMFCSLMCLVSRAQCLAHCGCPVSVAQ